MIYAGNVSQWIVPYYEPGEALLLHVMMTLTDWGSLVSKVLTPSAIYYGILINSRTVQGGVNGYQVCIVGMVESGETDI